MKRFYVGFSVTSENKAEVRRWLAQLSRLTARTANISEIEFNTAYRYALEAKRGKPAKPNKKEEKVK